MTVILTDIYIFRIFILWAGKCMYLAKIKTEDQEVS